MFEYDAQVDIRLGGNETQQRSLILDWVRDQVCQFDAYGVSPQVNFQFVEIFSSNFSTEYCSVIRETAFRLISPRT